jgi:hypothetical protein
MGRDLTMVALDSMSMTYWIEALSSVPGPPADPLSQEKIALARIFMWLPRECSLHFTPTVKREFEAIKARDKLDNHLDWAMVHLSVVMPAPDHQAVEIRASALRKLHKGENDCRIVAECELTGMKTLLTTDRDLLSRLRHKTQGVLLCLPSDYWAGMTVAKGTTPTYAPAPDNPMANCTWWRW